MVDISANLNQEYTLGYTYNSHPFKIVKGTTIQGPDILKGTHKINFILHVEKDQDQHIYFNNKGLKVDLYSKLVSHKELDELMVIKFPTKNDYDEGNVMKIGNISNIFYDRSEIQKKGESPEILLSVRPNPNRDDSKDKIYDGIFTFTL